MTDAEPEDIYVDGNGKLWRCIAMCPEPKVTFEEVEGQVYSPAQNNGYQTRGLAALGSQSYTPPPIVKARKSGGVTGAMWNGWKRIFRPGEPE